MPENIFKVNIEDEMKTAYIDYSMSVIVSRALPDVRDGLKPVQRRVFYGMLDLGVLSNRPYKKSARIVGEVLGKYHPHGDTSVYDTMVRLAQDWTLRYPLVDGQGNFGSIDGDSPAAMRYTEARLRKIAEEMLADIDKKTVDFQLNFDDTLEEPKILPSKVPNLIINGASGIAVGMATNMPPHNLGETIDGIIAYINNNDITVQELMKLIPAPDFPTGGIIYGYDGVKESYETGKGKIIMRAKYHIEEDNNEREKIIVTEIPYLVNKAELIEKTHDLITSKKIEGLSVVRDESDRHGIRIVYELKKDANTSVIVNNLFKHTDLQTSFNVNNIALVKGRPLLLTMRDLIARFAEHRHEVVVRRTKFELSEAEKQAHILEGLLVALDHLDEIITLIRKSKTPEDAKLGLIQNYKLTEIQAKAILDLRLQKLTALERENIKTEHAELVKKIKYFKDVLSDEKLRFEIIKKELLEIKDKFSDKRRTEIVFSATDFKIEDVIADENVVITISHLGYLKRTPLTEYRRQGRGGRGSVGSTTRDEDFIEDIFVATNHNYLLFFTQNGKCYWLRVYEIPEGVKASKGRPVQNLLNLEANDKVKACISVKSLEDEKYINTNFVILCTKKGVIKKTSLEAYSRPRQGGINSINIREDDELIEAKLTNGSCDLILAKTTGKAIRFNEQQVRPTGRTATGVRGVKLSDEKDEVIGMLCADPAETGSTVLVVSEKGYGKRTALSEYRLTRRGGLGVKTIQITDKTGNLIAIKVITDKDDLIIINKSGITIRMSAAELRSMGRATQGVKLIDIKEGDEIASVTRVHREDDELDEGKDGNGKSDEGNIHIKPGPIGNIDSNIIDN